MLKNNRPVRSYADRASNETVKPLPSSNVLIVVSVRC